jgi:hypothetical protein
MVGCDTDNAKDNDAMIAKKLPTDLTGRPSSFLTAVAEESRFPGMGRCPGHGSRLMNQIQSSGEWRAQGDDR